jgi:glycine reductase
MAENKLRAVHYLNQFFGGLGGEEKADTEPLIIEGATGPGRAIQNILGERGQVVATAICGDNYIGEKPEEAADEIIELVRQYQPDILIAGPAFEAGRYGIACGAVCKAAMEKLGIPAVTGMYRENPGVELYHKDVYVIRTGNTVKDMNEALTKMISLVTKLAAGEKPGKPAIDGYYPRGKVVNEESDRTGAERVVDMLLRKLKDEEYETEVVQPQFYRVKPAPAITDLSSAKIGLVTDGGLVPEGNPDNIESSDATHYGSYSFEGVEFLDPAKYEVRHGGYDNAFILKNPNRLVPVDIMRELEKKRKIGKLHEIFYSTTGVATKIENARRISQRTQGSRSRCRYSHLYLRHQHALRRSAYQGT